MGKTGEWADTPRGFGRVCSCINVYRPCATRTAVTKQPFQMCSESHCLFSFPLSSTHYHIERFFISKPYAFSVFWLWKGATLSPCHHSAGTKATWVSCRNNWGRYKALEISPGCLLGPPLGQCRLSLWGHWISNGRARTSTPLLPTSWKTHGLKSQLIDII